MKTSTRLLFVILLSGSVVWSTPRFADEPEAMLLDARGQVLLRRQNWSRFYPVQAGTQCFRGDLIQLDDEASATMLCSDFSTVWIPVSGELSGAIQGCPSTSSEVPIFRSGQLAVSTRGTAKKQPYIITPRHTAIRDPYPLLRWNAVEGTRQYTVQVIDADQGHSVWGPATVLSTEIPYPNDAPVLQPEVTYLVQVKTEHGVPSPTRGVGFRLLPEEKRQQITAHCDELKHKVSQATARQLAMAVYYFNQQLRSEALALLDILVQTSESAPIHLLRAHVLLDIGLGELAAQQYEQARHLAEQQKDPESQAEALAGLARTCSDPDTMEQPYQQAIELYKNLGDHERAEQLRKEMP